MRRAQVTIALTVLVTCLATSTPALAHVANGGQGWWGETTDKDVTMVMFATIAFFPVIIALFSFLQSRLDKRKHAREDAAKARAMSVEWRGGW